MKKIFVIKVENQPGVLYRLVNIFYKRKINIQAVNAFETKAKTISQVSITTEITQEMAEKVAKQINKIIEVIEVIFVE